MRDLKVLGLLAVFGALAAPVVHAQGSSPEMNELDSRYGAIAVANSSPSTWGTATNYTSPREASSAARRDCEKRGGKGCETVARLEGDCGALAKTSDSKLIAATGPYRTDARDAVLAKCKNDDLDGCQVVKVVCGDDPGTN